ncbi:protein shisa-9 isoform X4 [Herpailurus yagouaroundi]|uniref:protein shisa-9 isoform X4 n=1 Tax=Herpailurus yagouaroundi TaxID=1608482 RepID=UPI001AD6E9AE|nr:protein shisa-9 isoform X4 [Puma yagouaroundi]
MRRVLRLLLGCFLTELCARVCRAQERAGHGQLAQLGGVVVLAGGNRSGAASGEAGEGAGASDAPPTRAPTPDFCRGYFDVMGQWDPPFNCSSGDFIFCCGTCGFRFCCTFKKRRLNQSTCTNYDTPLWLNTGKPPARKDDPLHDPTKDKTNLIVYIICGVVAVMVLVGIFTKLGLEKAHRPQREHMSRALADVMRPQGHCNTDPMERDLNIVVHVQHYENMDTRTPINNLHATQMNNAVPTSPLLQQMGHPHSYPSLGQISNPYEQQPPGKELNKYASLKAVGERKLTQTGFSSQMEIHWLMELDSQIRFSHSWMQGLKSQHQELDPFPSLLLSDVIAIKQDAKVNFLRPLTSSNSQVQEEKGTIR